MAQWEAQSLGNFLRRIAIDYARFGYTRYVLKEIPLDKDPSAIDQKIRSAYQVTSCRTARMRMKRQGRARVQYLRFKHSFVLLATEGTHEAFARLHSYDMKDAPLHFQGYSIGFKGSTVSVQVTSRVWRRIERHMEDLIFQPQSVVEEAIASLPYYNFPGVVRQKQHLLHYVNQRRKVAGLQPITFNPLEAKRHLLRGNHNATLVKR